MAGLVQVDAGRTAPEPALRARTVVILAGAARARFGRGLRPLSGRLRASPPGMAFPGEQDLPDQAQESPDMHQDRDGRLSVEIVGDAGRPICRASAAAVPDSGEEVGESCAEHGGKSASGAKAQGCNQPSILSLMPINPAFRRQRPLGWDAAPAGVACMAWPARKSPNAGTRPATRRARPGAERPVRSAVAAVRDRAAPAENAQPLLAWPNSEMPPWAADHFAGSFRKLSTSASTFGSKWPLALATLSTSHQVVR